MKILILTNSQPNQIALVNKIYVKNKNISVIVRSPSKHSSNKKNFFSLKNLSLLICSFGAILFFLNNWLKVQKYFKLHFPKFPVDPILEVTDINDPAVILEIKKLKPELVIVSGTNLLAEHLIKTIRAYAKIINLHTGISPYVKGGPNCTNWCIYHANFSFIGNTVMWLDCGIDSGNIIVSEQTSLNGDESFFELHLKVLEHAHTLYLNVVQHFIDGKPLLNVSQKSISCGNLYLTRDWTAFKMLVCLLNFYCSYKKSFQNKRKSIEPILIKLQ